MKLAKKLSEIISYFTKNIFSSLKDYVLSPANENNRVRNWTNNNCESVDHISKLYAKWKTMKTPELIDLIHEITFLHFRDYRRALYGAGNLTFGEG